MELYPSLKWRALHSVADIRLVATLSLPAYRPLAARLSPACYPSATLLPPFYYPFHPIKLILGFEAELVQQRQLRVVRGACTHATSSIGEGDEIDALPQNTT